ncbi:hypothetical protein EDD17DRAFT_1079944 [Pisolithus thermaeus]|nr:hypothetical protein EDD17DRAFT_1079944 [Pisolithus thermaeus]
MVNRKGTLTGRTHGTKDLCNHCGHSRSSASVGKKRRRANYGVPSELKKRKSQTRKRPDGTGRTSKKGKEKVLGDGDGRNVPGVVNVVKSTRLETTLKELTMNTAALTEAITRNMATIAEERRERAECDHRTTEMMNLMLKVMHKIVDAGSTSSVSKRT